MADFTPTQGRYLAFIQAYTKLHGYPPAESDIAGAICVSPPSVNQMVKMLERKGLIQRQPGQARTLKILVPEDEIPDWDQRSAKTSEPHKSKKTWMPATKSANSSEPTASLYVLNVILSSGPVSPKIANKEISRKIEIRGDQTLEDLHNIIFKAYDREDEHLYEFQFGKLPFDEKGPNYRLIDDESEDDAGDVQKTKLDDLGLMRERTFGYWFDFGDDWYHQIHVEKIEQAIPTVHYPRIISRVGKSPPQYDDVE
jgi:hypothetical protein